MHTEHHEARADYEAAFEEGAAACERGADQTNPYDDMAPRAMKAGWADGFAAAQVAREEWESENHWRARNHIDGYNVEFQGAKPARSGEDY